MKTHSLPCSDAEVSALLAGATQLRRPVTLRNSEGGAYQRALFKLNEAWADCGTFEGRLHGVLKAPVHPHPLDTPPSVEGVVDRLHPRWSAYNDDEPEGRGDALWVLERHAIQVMSGYEAEDVEYGDYYEAEEAIYRASPRVGLRRWLTDPPIGQELPHHMRYLAESTELRHGPAHHVKRWRPASTMPRWAARIWLRVMAVHPERVGRRWYWVIDVAVESTTGKPKETP